MFFMIENSNLSIKRKHIVLFLGSEHKQRMGHCVSLKQKNMCFSAIVSEKWIM